MMYLVDTEMRTITILGLCSDAELDRVRREAKKRGQQWEVKIGPRPSNMHEALESGLPFQPADGDAPIGFRRKRS